MEENKNLIPETPTENSPRSIRFRMIKKGSYSAALTAIVLALIIALNFLVGVLADKTTLEFDMTKEKLSSLSDENTAFLKTVDTDVSVILCSDEYNYTNGLMDYYAENSGFLNGSEYYKQTIKLLEKYADINDNIKVEFVDTQDSAFTAVTTEYSSENISYGDIIVSSGKGESKRYQLLSFTDIYETEQNEYYSPMGYSAYDIVGNNLETALSGAIEYVVTGNEINFTVLTGHSKNDATEYYSYVLKQNNYSVNKIDSTFINEIDKDCDVLIIAAPTVDFLPAEIEVIENFLENGGKHGKGLLFFADSSAPVLPNLAKFLGKWGICVSEGILFETDSSFHYPEYPTSIFMQPQTDEEITENLQLLISGCNSPLKVIEPSNKNIVATSLIATSNSTVAAPLGTSDGWRGYADYETASYSGLIRSVKTGSKENSASSYVFAFSSIEFIMSEWINYSDVSNLNLALKAAEQAGSVTDSGISFISKTITNESFADKVTDSSANIIRIVFVFLIPIATVLLGVYIYIKRRNA